MKSSLIWIGITLLIALTGCGQLVRPPSPAPPSSPFPSLSSGKTAADFGAKTVLIVHYYRYDHNYSGWNLWVWPNQPVSLNGASYPFTSSDNFGEVAIIKFQEVYTQLGFIIRLSTPSNPWAAKDVAENRYVNIGSSGVAEIWVLEGQPSFYTSPPPASVLENRVRIAFLDSLNLIPAPPTVPDPSVTPSQVSVTADGVSLPVASAAPDPTDPNVLDVTLKNPLNPAQINQSLAISVAGYQPSIIYARDVLNNPDFFYGGQLGPIYSPTSTTFRVWSPPSTAVSLELFSSPSATTPYATYPMSPQGHGVWQVSVAGNLNGVYYLYSLTRYGKTVTTVDPYSIAASADNSKSEVVDLAATDPPGWNQDPYQELPHRTQAVVYELDVRDFTIDPSSNIPSADQGTYLGVIQTGANQGEPTALGHLLQLGVNMVELMPIFDYWNVPFSSYNWGYNPFLYNVPAPYYSTDPNNPAQTIEEVKQMILGLHEVGIGVIMDVVYNHTYFAGPGSNSPFRATVPYYYHLTDLEGNLIDETGTGNTLATGNTMVRQFILQSLLYWVQEYHINGFRFDLLGTFDPTTVEDIVSVLTSVDPHILLYGEPYAANGPASFTYGQQEGLRIGFFNPYFRDALAGSVFNISAPGYIEGAPGNKAEIEAGVTGSLLSYPTGGFDFTANPGEVVNYVEDHDNCTLWDRISAAEPFWSTAQKIDAQEFAGAILMTSQGIAFLSEGTEFASSKQGNCNSYNAGDGINEMRWSRVSAFAQLNAYWAGLIHLRLAHPAFQLNTGTEVQANLHFLSNLPPHVVGFTINGAAVGDSWNQILVYYNGSTSPAVVQLPPGSWNLVVNNQQAGTLPIASGLSGTLPLAPLSADVLYE